MENETFFLYNDDVEERNKFLNEILKELYKKPKPYYKKAKFLKYYVDALVIASKHNEIIQKESVKDILVKTKEIEVKKIKIAKEFVKPQFKPVSIQKPIEPVNILRSYKEYKESGKVGKVEVPAFKEMDFSSFMQKKMRHLMPPPPRPVGIYASKSSTSLKKEVPLEETQQKDTGYIFNVEEEKLNQLNNRVLDILKTAIDSSEKMQFFDDLFLRAIKKLNVKENEVDKLKIKSFLERDINGLGKIDALFRNLKVRGIYCYGLNIPVLIDHTELGNSIKTDVLFLDSVELNKLIVNIAKLAGKEINEDNPILDGVLASGERIQLTFGTDFLNAKFVVLK